MFTKMVIAYIDVLGSRSELWESGKFKGTGVVVKNLAVNIRLSANDRNIALPHRLDEIHDWNDISQCHEHGNIFSFVSSKKSHLGLEFGSPDDGAPCITKHNPTASGLSSVGVDLCKRPVLVAREISITVALKTFS
jgi:hypothetical protein